MLVKRIEEVFECIGLASLIVLVFLAAVLRFFGLDMSWSTDMAQLVFAWVCFIGADLAMRQDRHMGVNMLVDRFSLKTQNGVLLFNNVFIIGFLILVAVYGTNLCIVNYQRTFNTLPISYSYATASAPVGCALMIITTIIKIKTNIMNFAKSDYTSLEKKVEGGDVL